jgi:hypothetical protein
MQPSVRATLSHNIQEACHLKQHSEQEVFTEGEIGN